MFSYLFNFPVSRISWIFFAILAPIPGSSLKRKRTSFMNILHFNDFSELISVLWVCILNVTLCFFSGFDRFGIWFQRIYSRHISSIFVVLSFVLFSHSKLYIQKLEEYEDLWKKDRFKKVWGPSRILVMCSL